MIVRDKQLCKWTIEEVELLKKMYRTHSSIEIGEKLGRKRSAISMKSKHLGLKKTPEEISQIHSIAALKHYSRITDKHSRVWSGYCTRKRREKLLTDLGGRCSNCGFNNYDILQFDHINNDGNKYDISILKQVENHPEEFQILCPNCNILKEIYYRTLLRLERLNIPPF